MQVETIPSYGHYSCDFVTRITQGNGSPIAITATRNRSSDCGRVTVQIKVGEVSLAEFKATADDVTALSELFNRAHYYVFPPEKTDD